MSTGELLTRWSVRASLAFYVVGLLLRACSRGRRSLLIGNRLAWTGGYFLFLLHLFCAFEFYHGWSHRAAYKATARQTEEIVGLDWGGGIWANYLFAVVWGLDVVWWWRSPAGYEARSRGIEWAIQGFLAFIAFNATVVFGMGAIRWFGVGGCLLLAGVLGYAAYGRRKPLWDGPPGPS